MKRGRALVLAILTYVTLDLSLASMPGAFVFDAAATVDSAQGGRARAAAEPMTRAADPCAPAPLHTMRAAPAPPGPSAAAPREPSAARCRPRAALDPAPPADDPY